MPMYEYKCGQCGEVFELIQRFSDEPLKTHEGCGGSVERLLSAPAFQFKGSGWYVTDYAKSGNPTHSGDKKRRYRVEAAASTLTHHRLPLRSPSTSSPSTSTSSDSKK